MLAGVYAVLMLLTGWGNIQKGRFFKRGLIPNLEQYLSVMKPDKRDEDRPVQEQLCVVAPRHKQASHVLVLSNLDTSEADVHRSTSSQSSLVLVAQVQALQLLSCSACT